MMYQEKSQRDPVRAVWDEAETAERAGYPWSEVARCLLEDARWSPTVEVNHPKGDPAWVPVLEVPVQHQTPLVLLALMEVQGSEVTY